MGYFQVRYDSRVVNYNRRGFIRLATGHTDGECSLLSTFNLLSRKPGADLEEQIRNIILLPGVNLKHKFWEIIRTKADHIKKIYRIIFSIGVL